MVRLLVTIVSLLTPFAPAVAMAPPDVEVGYTIGNTIVTGLVSPDGHNYRIMVAWPPSPPPPAGWPVLYVLDGDDGFAVVTQTTRRLLRAGARGGVEPGLVVAIESGDLPRRVLDYTPATPGYAIPASAPAQGLATGGGDVFLDFVARQVQPMIARRWRVDGRRQTLLGHSFGGLIALHALFTRPAMFSGIVAISPSLWFGGDLVTRDEQAFRLAPGAPAKLLVSVGVDERGADAGSGAAAAALVARLSTKGVAARFISLNGQTHGTTMLATMGMAVAAAFAPAEDRE